MLFDLYDLYFVLVLCSLFKEEVRSIHNNQCDLILDFHKPEGLTNETNVKKTYNLSSRGRDILTFSP